MGILSAWFGSTKRKARVQTLLAKGAIVLDVRTEVEYANGAIAGSRNIPLNELPKAIGSLSKETPIITCCASGIRSQLARDLLLKSGFKTVENGGSWKTLRNIIPT
jgi:phage shock protein E